MDGETRPDEVTGTLHSVEFLVDGEQEDDDAREPGTYVTVRIDDPNLRWSAGRVALRYLVK